MDLLVRRLLAQAQLFDDPAAYEAGVRDALDLLQREHSDVQPAHTDLWQERPEDRPVDLRSVRDGDRIAV